MWHVQAKRLWFKASKDLSSYWFKAEIILSKGVVQIFNFQFSRYPSKSKRVQTFNDIQMFGIIINYKSKCFQWYRLWLGSTKNVNVWPQHLKLRPLTPARCLPFQPDASLFSQSHSCAHSTEQCTNTFWAHPLRLGQVQQLMSWHVFITGPWQFLCTSQKLVCFFWIFSVKVHIKTMEKKKKKERVRTMWDKKKLFADWSGKLV